MQCDACTSQLTANMDSAFVYKEDILYLFMSSWRKFPIVNSAQCLSSACEFLFKAVIFKLFRFSIVLIENMAF